jgi:hypothetical protein
MACGDPPYIGFNWRYAQERGDDKMRLQVSVIRRVRPLKFGYLHQCVECGQFWVLDDQENFIERVRDDLESILFEWDATPLPISKEHLCTLSAIGGTGGDRYGNGRERIEIPCAITVRDAAVNDPAVLWITKKPPLADYPKMSLFRDVASVTPTDYALSLDVRRRTLLAHEVGMGYAPTLVESSSGEKFILNWSPCLFFHDGIKGREIHLSEERSEGEKSIPLANIIDTIDPEVVHFFADWFPGAEELNRAQ